MTSNPYGIIAVWQQGDFLIKGVAVLLMLLSVAVWSVIVLRTWRLISLRRMSKRAADFWHAQSFIEGLQLLGPQDSDNPFRYLAEEAEAARDHHQTHKSDLHGQLTLADWMNGSLRTALDDSSERMQKGLSILASVGSTAPFIGLFGTVWGIYHALVGIAASGQSSIDKVAGPVGEALIMTAFGLAVAIPAVLGYNALVRSNKNLLTRLNRFAYQLHAYFLTGTPPTRKQDSTLRAVEAYKEEAI